MSARFKFRVWDNEERYYKYEFDLMYGAYELSHVFNDMDMNEKDSTYPLCDGVIEQCTGLKDKNGKLIYENDVLKLSKMKKDIYVVCKWSDDGYIFIDNEKICRSYYDYEMEIIGNIHENNEI